MVLTQRLCCVSLYPRLNMQRFSSLTALLASAVTLAACGNKDAQPQPQPAPVETPVPASDAPTSQSAPTSQKAAMAKPNAADIDVRYDAAIARLNATPEGKLIKAAMDAQGGLAKWYANGPLGFRFEYKPVDTTKKVRDTYQVVDTWSSRAVHSLHADKSIKFGWDGKQAWTMHTPEQKLDINPRFWSMTPYYFVGMPFVLADEGVNFAMQPDTTVDGKTYKSIKVTYNANVGDAPDDYYIVHLDPTTSRLKALSYIVSYKGFFPNGGSTPEKFMTYEGEQIVDGITLPTLFKTYATENGARGALQTNTSLTNVSFLPDTPSAFFAAPAGATIVDKM